jgi:hypothetical protein
MTYVSVRVCDRDVQTILAVHIERFQPTLFFHKYIYRYILVHFYKNRHARYMCIYMHICIHAYIHARFI